MDLVAGRRRGTGRRPTAGPDIRPTTRRPGSPAGRHRHKITSLIAAIESGVDPTLLGQQLANRTAERDRIIQEIGRLEPKGAMSAREIRSLIDVFGSVAKR